MKIIKFFPKILFLLGIILSISLGIDLPQVLTIETSDIGPPISHTLYGIFFEDINHAIDGGIYAELIRNRSFEHTDKLEGWNIQNLSNSGVKIYVDNKNSIHKNNLNYLKMELPSDTSEVVITNNGYGGIPLKKGEKYILSYYIKGDPNFEGTIRISLSDKRGNLCTKEYMEKVKFLNEWKKFSIEFTSNEEILEAQLVIRIKGIGNICLDMVSLFPEKTWNGMRLDLVKMLEELKPGFVRFPGGCLVEGDSLRNAYRWKDTIGRIEERKTNKNLWGYHQSYGIGFYEYLLLCEHLSAEPVPIFNAGMSCQVRGAEYCPIDQMKEWVQDVLDFIEFANGPINTYWGSIRASLGHPKPFNVKYIGIGNENWGEEYHTRFQLFWKAIKEKYP
ncbi:MAG: carbohydrate binding domain-containing protein, partial [Dictyoglomaceae bacterium]|nr:carbohydrate binding domain-containing protein [Dictyoglomaceae bacterium]